MCYMKEKKRIQILKVFASIVATLAALCTIVYFVTGNNFPSLIKWEKDDEVMNGDNGKIDDESEYSLDIEVYHFPSIGNDDHIFGGTWQATDIHEDIPYGSWSVKVSHRIDPEQVFVPVEVFGLILYDTEWKEPKYYFPVENWNIVPIDVSRSEDDIYPKGSSGTFIVYIPDVKNAQTGYYTIEITIEIDGEERSIIYPLWMDEDISYHYAMHTE